MVLISDYDDIFYSCIWRTCKKPIFFVFVVTFLIIRSCEAAGTFGFDIHHRYSEPVKRIFNFDGLPEKGSPEYFSAMAHRDQLIRGRHLASTTPTTFVDGNDTVQIDSLGFLYYANVSIGTPSLWFLVALDTGSDLFWLPCDCQNCVGSLVFGSGQHIDLNAYYPNASSTSKVVSCSSNTCDAQWTECSTQKNACAYEVNYLSNGTSSAGILVDDVLHLATENSDQKVDAPITLGCGVQQTGGFLNGAAPNGLFGLGMDNVSVPSMLANQGFASNSFSMCFGQGGLGRIVFGDKGSLDQAKTPFNIDQTRLIYNISLTQIVVGDNITNLSTTAVFDSGTSFTYLTDPAYSVMVENFNSKVTQPRHPSDPQLPFEYCYDLSANETTIDAPFINLTMKSESQFSVNMPFEIFPTKEGGYVYCLGILKSDDINIIGQNFMTGYRVVFNREEMVLGWRPSDCNDAVTNGSESSTTKPINHQNSTGAPSPSTVSPEATSGGNDSPAVIPPLPTAGSMAAPKNLNSFSNELFIFVLSFLSFYMASIISSV